MPAPPETGSRLTRSPILFDADCKIRTKIQLFPIFSTERSNFFKNQSKTAARPSVSGKLAAKKAKITVLTADDIPGLDRGRIGDPGSPTKVPRTYPPEAGEPGMMIDEGSLDRSAAKLASLLAEAL